MLYCGEPTRISEHNTFCPRFNLNLNKSTIRSFDNGVNCIVIYKW